MMRALRALTTRRMIIALAGAGALVAGVAAIAAVRAHDPARCPSGLVALGPRCCGEGQRLEQGHCVGAPTRCAGALRPTPRGCISAPRRIAIAGGTLRIGPGDWEAEGTVTPREVVMQPFAIDAFEVTEDRYRECVTAGACEALARSGEPGAPVIGVTRDEAARFCSWAGGDLPTPDQLAFASAGPRSRRYPWGDTGAVCRRVAWGLGGGPCASGGVGPELAGSRPDGATPEGVFDLSGNVAEWTRGTDAVAEVRGGSWVDSAAAALRSWSRREVAPTTRAADIGFRCSYAPR